ncbi:MAG: TraB/GumN family protein, partial [Nitrospinales bacterium]
MATNTNEDIIKTLQVKDTTITLVGTAHVSQSSVRLVEEKINTGEFDCIAVELCESRYQNLTNN